MANTTTYGNISDRSLSIADAVEAGPAGSAFVTSADMLAWINQSLTELYEELVDADQDLFTATQDLTLVASTAAYSLTTDPYRIISLYYRDTSGQRYELYTVPLTDLHKLPLSVDNRSLRWSMFGADVKFYPTPSASGTVEVTYIPEVTLFSGTVGTAITGTFPRGSEEYIIQDVASKILEKQEQDSSTTVMRKQQALQRIVRNVKKRRPVQPNGTYANGNFSANKRSRASLDNNTPPRW